MQIELASKPDVAIGAIVKNEGPYILEWVAFHRVLGVERFFIADNDSSDGTTELLAALQSLGLINHIPFPHVPGKPPQLPAYAEIIRRHADDADWIAFIDADEFLVPSSESSSLPLVLAEFGEDVGTVTVNWAIYGSSSQWEPSRGLVTERFTRRADQRFGANCHYKSIVRSSACLGTGGNPHSFQIKREFRSIHIDGEALVYHPTHGAGVSASVHWHPFRLNHYIIKSRAEFDMKKTPRGSAAVLSRQKGDAYFASYDRNEILDPAPSWLVEATKNEMERIRNILRTTGVSDAVVRLDEVVKTMVPLRAGEGARTGRACIDSASVSAGSLTVKGWAFGSEGRAIERFSLKFGDHSIEEFEVSRKTRSDVARKFPGAVEDCGFEIKLPLINLPKSVFSASSFQLSMDEGGAPVLTREVSWPEDMIKGDVDLPKIPSVPSMPQASVDALREALEGARCYLEYGTGGSTVMACQIGVPAMICVESDLAWLKGVQNTISEFKRPEVRHLVHADIGPTKELGYPVSDASWRSWHDYPLGAWQLCEKNGLYPDLVLVDGRFRVACFLATLLCANPGTRVFFDDYVDRPHYHSVEKFVSPIRTIDRVAEFTRPRKLDRDAVWSALMTAVTDPS